MNDDNLDPTKRFSDRVSNYVKFRPGYPQELFDFLKNDLELNKSLHLVEVGSGTGIFSEYLLRDGFNLICIEPNLEMRTAAEKALSKYTGFKSINGRSEATTLTDECADFIFAVQAFHWFEAYKTKSEFKRIIKPGGKVVLIWNERRVEDSDFLRGYEDLVCKYGIDYQKVNHKNMSPKAIKDFLGDHGYGERSFYNFQNLDFQALVGRLASSSYMPGANHPKYPAMVEAFKKLFDTCQIDRKVKVEYDAKVFYSSLI